MKIKQIIIKENTNDNINIKKDEAKPKEIIPLFGLKEKPKEENNAKKEKEKEIEKEKDAKPIISLFFNSGGGLFNQSVENKSTHSLFGNINTNTGNEKKESKEVFNNKKTSIFSNLIVPNEKPEEKNKE